MTGRATGGRWMGAQVTGTPRTKVVRAAIVLTVLMGATLSAAGCSDPSSTTPPSPTTSSIDPTRTTDTTIADTDTDTDTEIRSTDSMVDGAGVLPEGFTTVQVRITAAVDGEVCEVCLWLADDDGERARGLMGVTDLGDAAGMLFRFDEERTGSFYMFQTPTPLSIAWFGADGRYVDSADMAPCLDTAAGDCPLYTPGAEYTMAIEVFEGGLESLGIGPGASVEVISESDRCPVDSSTP
jgi:uncharacterized protein